MATPTYPSKRYYAAGTIKGANWGTAVAIGANCGLLITGDTGLKRSQTFEPYPAIDQIMAKDGVLGINEPVEITAPLNLQYEMGKAGSWIAALFGTAGAPANAGTNAYEHTFQWANSVTNFFTYIEERPGHIWESPSAMPYKATFSLDGANVATSVVLRGNTLIDDSAVNGANQADAITYVSRSTFLHFSHGQFLMNTQAGGALSANNDSVLISDFEINYERVLDTPHVAGAVNIVEPIESEMPNCTVKVTLPRASNTNLDYFSTFEDMTAQKATLIFTGAAVGNNTYTVGFYFPRLMLINPPEVPMEAAMRTTLTFAMQEASAAPTGMNYARPYLKVVNGANADYLG